MADYKEEVPERFRINYNKLSGAFYILDMHNESVRNLPPDATIPEDSPAMKVLSGLEVNALLGELNKMGWIEKLFGARTEQAAVTPRVYQKTTNEIAIENITAIIQSGKDESVSKEAIMAIREIVAKI